MVSRYVKQGTDRGNCGNTGQFWKGTRTPLGDPHICKYILNIQMTENFNINTLQYCAYLLEKVDNTLKLQAQD